MQVDEARRIDEQNTLRRARLLNIGYFDTAANQIELYKDILTVQELYDYKLIPLYADAHNIKFGITNNTSQMTMNNIRHRFADQSISFYMISDVGYRQAMERYDPPPEVVYNDISITEQAENQVEMVSATLNQVRADDMLAYLVKQAYSLKASDIHLETDDDNVRIRFRVDGVLHPIAELTPEKYRQLVSSLAIAANISTSSRDAQTGHINDNFELADGSSVTVNLRVESVPTVHGMDAVLRLFNLKPELLRVDKLGLKPEEEKVVKEIISHPSGLVLLVGPTGSGKTTTLYSMISELNSPERKIITLEDPVEYQIKGITQIPVDSRNDANGFAEKLRAVLRLDPDVIMVGEIRDADTAKTALQSALTGHLVLSTYHASSASAAITRMMNTVGDSPLFSSSVRLITAQRLLRKLDQSTKQEYTPDQKTADWIKDILSTLPETAKKPDLSNIKLYRPGKSAENPFGYTGQMAVREFLVMSPQILEELTKPVAEISAHSIELAANKDGMVTILQDAVLQALAGVTSIEEVVRTVG